MFSLTEIVPVFEVLPTISQVVKLTTINVPQMYV